MAEKTGIRWAGSSWNPMTGCTEVSPGCDHCYAREFSERVDGLAFPRGFEPMLRPKSLRRPYTWKRPTRIFVNSMSDLFHRAFTQEDVDKVFDIMLDVDRHDYLILTKRPERMKQYIMGHTAAGGTHVGGWLDRQGLESVPPNIWLGTSIEMDKFTYRADILRDIPVPIRFISAEPLLEAVPSLNLKGIAWLIVGGESGPGFRPMDHEWARDLLRRASGSNTAFFFKQSSAPRTEMGITLDGKRWEQYPAADPIKADRYAHLPTPKKRGQIGLGL